MFKYWFILFVSQGVFAPGGYYTKEQCVKAMQVVASQSASALTTPVMRCVPSVLPRRR